MEKCDFLEKDYNLEKIAELVYAGKIQNYYTVASIDKQTKTILTKIGICKDTGIYEIEEILKNIDFDKKVSFKLKDNTINIEIPIYMSEYKTKELFEKTIKSIVNELIKSGYETGSFISGENNNIQIAQIGDDYLYVDEFEKDELTNDEDNKQIEYEQINEKLYIGFKGFLMVGVLSIVFYIVLGILNMPSYFAGALSLILAYFLYLYFARKLNKKTFSFVLKHIWELIP